MTFLAFNNSEMITMLKKRGNLIKQEKWKELVKINSEMNKFLVANRHKFITPCSVFMTFADEEGYNRCCNFGDTINDSDANTVRRLSSFLGEPGT